MSMNFTQRGASAADRLIATAKRNPEGALLVAAGVALMMRGMGRHRRGSSSYRSAAYSRGSSPYQDRGEFYGSEGHDEFHQHQESGNQSPGMMDKAREHASDMSGRVRKSAEDIAGYASDMSRTAMERSSHLFDRTSSTVQSGVGRMVEEQPLALAILGLAAGAAAASLVPASRLEERTLGPIGERITEGASDAARRLKESATESAKHMAATGLADVAKDVVESFTSDSGSRESRSHPSDASREGKTGSMDRLAKGMSEHEAEPASRTSGTSGMGGTFDSSGGSQQAGSSATSGYQGEKDRSRGSGTSGGSQQAGSSATSGNQGEKDRSRGLGSAQSGSGGQTGSTPTPGSSGSGRVS